MPKLLSQRSKKNLVIDIHPLADTAYQFFRSQSFLFEKTKLGISTIDSIFEGHVFSVIQVRKNKYQLIGGFEVIGFSLNQIDFQHHNLLIYDGMSDTDIEQFAWKNVLRVLLTSIDCHQLESIRKSFNKHAPTPIVQEFFSSKSLTQAHLARISQVSISGLKKQKSSQPIQTSSETIKQSSPSLDTPNIFERLLREIKNESRQN